MIQMHFASAEDLKSSGVWAELAEFLGRKKGSKFDKCVMNKMRGKPV